MKVGIVGAGPAGLHAALALQRDHDVSLFEARDRLGGRLFTHPSGYEAGGEWIDGDHSRCINSLRACSIEPEPSDAVYRIHVGGESFDGPNPTMVAAKHRIDLAAEALSRPLKPTPWENERSPLDEESVDQFFGAFCTPDESWWPTAYYRSDEGEDLSRVGLLGWLCGYRNYLDREEGAASAFRVPGGMSAWMEELGRSLKNPPQFHQVLEGVVQSGDQVWLDFGGRAIAFDHVVITLPPRSLGRLRFDPDLPDPKTAAIEACKMGRTIKVGLVYARRWWEEVGWSGFLFSDTALQQIWPTLDPSPTLCVYVGGDAAIEWINCPDPASHACALLEQLVPGGAEHFLGGALHDWVSDPFASGGFSHLAPGYVLGPMRHIADPVGRVHFAGEYTSLWTGFIEGALESAERVTAEINECANS